MESPGNTQRDRTAAQDDPNLRFRSPWLDQLDPAAAPCPLERDLKTDVVIIGAGIAGLASAFFLLRDTQDQVVLVERDRAGHGASGRNAGQLVTYFERPLCDLVDTFGFDIATRAQREIDTAWDLLDLILRETGMSVPVERFQGGMGMFTLNHLMVHLRNLSIRKRADLAPEVIEVSQDAPFLGAIPAEFKGLYAVVPQARIRERLSITGDDYLAVLLNRKGCGNSALMCQEILRFLMRHHAGRFTYHDHTEVGRIVLDEGGALVETGEFSLRAARVVLCTNGFNLHRVENRAGGPIGQPFDSGIEPIVGYMAGYVGPPGDAARAESYIVNEVIGGENPYYYITRRPYRRGQTATTLTCLGGPEQGLADMKSYDPQGEMPKAMHAVFDRKVRPATFPDRPAGLPYDYTWHGLMAYTANKIRLVGHAPENPVLMYNLGCNGVGFLPSIAGGQRIARLHGGEVLEPSLFDPGHASRPTDAGDRQG